MITDLDIYRSANILVKQHGENAPIEAAMKADAMLERGDMKGFAVWRWIVKAPVELLTRERPAKPPVRPSLCRSAASRRHSSSGRSARPAR